MSNFKLFEPTALFLKSLSRKATLWFGSKCISLALSALLLSWHITFFCDRFFDPSSLIRSLILLVGILGVFATAIFFLHFSKTNKSSNRWLAKRVRLYQRHQGERLLGIVELSETNSNQSQPKQSKELFEAAQSQLVNELASIHPSRIFTWKENAKINWLFCLLCLLPTILAIMYYPMFHNSLERWASPFKNTPRFTLARVSDFEHKQFVPTNENTVIRFSLSKDSKLLPQYAFLSGLNESKFRQKTKRNGRIFEFEIPPLQQQKEFILSCGDYMNTFVLCPMKRPRIEKCLINIQWPEYLAFPNNEIELRNRRIEILRGCKVEIKGMASEDLSLISLKSDNHNQIFTPNSKEFGFHLPPLNQSSSCKIHFVSSANLSPQKPFSFGVEVIEDRKPQINFEQILDFTPILEFETRGITFSIEDDLGLHSYSLHLDVIRSGNTVFENLLVSKEFSNSNTESFTLTYPFEPKFFGLQDGDLVQFTVIVKDNFPHREPVTATTSKFKIIGSAKHAQMIKSEMTALVTRLTGIARDQETLESQTSLKEIALEAIDSIALNTKEQSDINFLHNQQTQLSSTLSKSSSMGLSLLKKASINPVFEASELRDFGNVFRNMQEISDQEMVGSAKLLLEAHSSNRNKAQKFLANASTEQKEALKKLKDLVDWMSQNMDQLEAKTLAKRLRNIEKNKGNISDNLISIIPQTLGRSISSLSQKEYSYIQALRDKQIDLRTESNEIQNEISRYFERTGVSEYQKVSMMMEQSGTKSALQKIANSIEQNIGFKALNDLTLWRKRFSRWAEILENQVSQMNQAGGEGSSSSKDFSKEILNLLKIRNEQKVVLQKTIFSDKQDTLPKKKEWMVELSKRQNKLAVDLTDTQISLANEPLNPLFDEAHTAMSSAVQLLNQNLSGAKTQQNQENAKNIISDLINLLIEGQANGNTNESEKDFSMLDFLLMEQAEGSPKRGESKSPTPGKKGGGSNQSGKSEKSSTRTEGPQNESRNRIRKPYTGATIKPNIPSEFKEAMQRYYKAIEK